jgi:diguanylate cyclase (GGDEF)-like protein
LLFSQTLDLSIKDGLTGCFNRRKFDIDIIAEIAKAKSSGAPVSLLMVDIDWFKNYNDFHGHPKGDELLRQIAGMLMTNVRALDTVYRYGGEEFAILLPNTDKSKTLIAAHRLQAVVGKKQFEGETQSQPEKKLTISIGLANSPADASTYNELIKAADSALYKAKKAGRNQVCAFAR